MSHCVRVKLYSLVMGLRLIQMRKKSSCLWLVRWKNCVPRSLTHHTNNNKKTSSLCVFGPAQTWWSWQKPRRSRRIWTPATAVTAVCTVAPIWPIMTILSPRSVCRLSFLLIIMSDAMHICFMVILESCIWDISELGLQSVSNLYFSSLSPSLSKAARAEPTSSTLCKYQLLKSRFFLFSVSSLTSPVDRRGNCCCFSHLTCIHNNFKATLCKNVIFSRKSFYKKSISRWKHISSIALVWSNHTERTTWFALVWILKVCELTFFRG